MRSATRDLSQDLHLATILQVNSPVHNLRLRRGVTVKNTPDNLSAVSFFFPSPLKGHLAHKAWVFPRSRKIGNSIFPGGFHSPGREQNIYPQFKCSCLRLSNQGASDPVSFLLFPWAVRIIILTLQLGRKGKEKLGRQFPKSAAAKAPAAPGQNAT